MADLLTQSFTGLSALPGGWTTDHATGGAHTVGSNVLDVTCTATAGSRGRVLSPTVATWADGDTLTARVTVSTSFVSDIVLRQDLSTTVFNLVIYRAGANWQGGVYRQSTGIGAIIGGTTGRDADANQWVRFRRVSATSCALEAAPDAAGVPGTWLLIATAVGADAWPQTWNTSQLEIMTNDTGGGTTAGNTTVPRVGDGSGGGGGGSVAAVIRRRRSLI